MKTVLAHKTIMAVLAFVAASGGYGGYVVLDNYQTYGANFEKRLHMVEEVVDGDTIVIENGIRIRLLNINAPELAECYGPEAKEKLEKLILGQHIRLEKDESGKDGYDRLLRYVFLRSEHPEVDDVHVNVALVEEGSAQAHYVQPNRQYLAKIQAVEREAQENKRGLWNACEQKEQIHPEREQDTEPFSNECVIKGNISKEYTKDYFLPGCPNYKRVKIDPRKGEEWFCSEEDAKEAGWQMSAACTNIHQFQE